MSVGHLALPPDAINGRPVHASPLAASSPTSSNHLVQPLVRRRIVVAGASTTIVEALAAALANHAGLEVLFTAMTYHELLALIGQNRLDAIVLYVPDLDASTIAVVNQLKGPNPMLRVVLLAGRPSAPFLAQAAAAGVAACLSLNARLRDLAEAVRAETTETMLVDAATLSEPSRVRPSEPPGQNAADLTRRELEVLALLDDGYSPPAIAAKLVISIYTARGHVKNVLRKLGSHSQLEAVAAARKLGLLGPTVPTATDPGPDDRQQGKVTAIVPPREGRLLGWPRHA
jgi:DNA-binding NarL/FixJ family response regulator